MRLREMRQEGPANRDESSLAQRLRVVAEIQRAQFANALHGAFGRGSLAGRYQGASQLIKHGRFARVQLGGLFEERNRLPRLFQLEPGFAEVEIAAPEIWIEFPGALQVDGCVFK